MSLSDVLTSWNELWAPTPSRRGALKLLGGSVLGGALLSLVDEDAGAACRKRGRCNRRRRCCRGFVCKRGRCRKKPGRRRPGQPGAPACPAGQQRCGSACTNLDQDPRNCGACGNRCEGGTTCAAGFCTLAIGEPGTGPRQFNAPTSVATDVSGRLYVTDALNDRVQVLTSAGDFIREFGGFGDADGAFSTPSGIAAAGGGENGPLGSGPGAAAAGDIYVADQGNHRIQQFDSAGNHIRSWGTFGGGRGQFNQPAAVAVRGNTVVVADLNNDRVQRFTANGFFLGQFGGKGSANGRFDAPQGVAIDAQRNILVADTENNRIQVFDGSGGFIRSFGGGVGQGKFNAPHGIAVDGAGNIWVADRGNDRIQVFTPEGALILVIGRRGAGLGELNNPQGIAVSPLGFLAVADAGNDRLQLFLLNRG
jgi:sugar lactone lactonase YvrE